MRRLLLALAALCSLLAAASRAADPPADPKVAEAQAKLLEVLLDEAKVDERTKAVAALGALDSLPAAKSLAESLEKLAARTTQAAVRAAKTQQDYQPYKGAAQANDRDWAIKQRLLQQMEKDDALLCNDGQVLDAFVAAVAALANKDAVLFLDRTAAKSELVPARRVLAAGLLANAAANVREVVKRAMADSEPSVRLAALGAMTVRKDPSFAEHAVKSLTDPDWPLRQAATRALAALGDLKAVGPLVSAMSGEDGRLLEDYADALQKLTGATLGPNPEAWKRWYDEHKAEIGGRPAPNPVPKLGKNPLAPPVDYYGIQTRSLKLLFLIDCSGSMNETIGQAGVTTGEQFTGKKIDIAKRMLKAAIMQLHPSTEFNVIVFNTDARQLAEKMVVATPEEKHRMNERVDELVGRGGTYTYGGLKLAFGVSDGSVTPTKPPIDTIFLLSDGAPTEATFEDGVPALPMDPQKILDAVRQWNPFRAVVIHTIAIDPRIESPTVGAKFIRLMKDLAAENRGTYTAIGSK